MRNLLVFFVFLSFCGNAQNLKNSERTAATATYTVCNPDSGGTFQLMYNDVYNMYGFYKTTRRTYYYNSNNKNSYGVHQYCTMNPNDTVWNNQWKWTCFYDSNNNLTDSVDQYWDATLQQWTDTTERTRYVYDLNDNVISITKALNYNGWLDRNRISHIYNSANLLITSKYHVWDTISNSWFMYDSLKYIYDVNNRLTNKEYHYNYMNVWYQNVKDTIHYNALNDPTYLLKMRKNGTGGWTIAKEIAWTYDPSGRILSRVCTGSDWEPLGEDDGSYYYSYDADGRQRLDNVNGNPFYSSCSFVGINEKNKVVECYIFPNPAASTISIKSSVDYSLVNVINAIGQTVLIVENKQEPISVSDLSNGIYFIQLVDKKGVVLRTEKLIKN